MAARRNSGWWKRKLLVSLGVLVVLAAVGGAFTWYKFFREEPQPDWITKDPDMRFKYGSIGAEREAGMPYWIFYVLPRMFPDKLPKPGGLAALGVSWEQGQELPIGFTKKVVGFPRVANNCASCHAAGYQTSPEENPVFVGAGPGHTLYLEGLFRFFVDCAKDPRFNADNLMREIRLVTDLSWVDRQIYRFLLIPITRKRLLEREGQFAWVYRTDLPDWGRGRDDAMNLTKYFLVNLPMDKSTGPTDIPSIWNLKKYDREGTTMNWAGDSHDTATRAIPPTPSWSGRTASVQGHGRGWCRRRGHRRHGGGRPRHGQERRPEPNLQGLRGPLPPRQGLPGYRLPAAPPARVQRLSTHLSTEAGPCSAREGPRP